MSMSPIRGIYSYQYAIPGMGNKNRGFETEKKNQLISTAEQYIPPPMLSSKHLKFIKQMSKLLIQKSSQPQKVSNL